MCIGFGSLARVSHLFVVHSPGSFEHSPSFTIARVQACVRGQADDSLSNATAQQHASRMATATPPQETLNSFLPQGTRVLHYGVAIRG